MGQGQSVSMEDICFNLKMTTKQLERMSKKAEKGISQNKAQVKKYMQSGNNEAARIYAENAIRKKNESLNYLKMAARVDATAQRIQSSMAMKGIAHQMGSVVKGMEKAMASMDLEQIANVMDKFEAQFTEMDVRAGVVENAMSGATASSMPEDQIDSLLRQVADENNLEVVSALAEAPTSFGAPADQEASAEPGAEQQSDLERRLAELRAA